MPLAAGCPRCGGVIRKGRCLSCGLGPEDAVKTVIRQTRPPPPQADAVDSLEGKQLGRFTVESELARGGMAVVYRGRSATGRRVAIKVMQGIDETTQPGEHAAAERRALQRIRHKGIVTMLDNGKLPTGQPYLVMELLEGETLHDFVTRRGAAPALESLRLMAEISDALAAAHAASVVHRDLNPSNIILVPDGEVLHAKVLDFGLARSGGATEPSGLMGTPAFMAPEQIREEPPTPKVDVYALGLIAYYLLTAQTPFAKDNLARSMHAQLVEAPPPPSQMNPTVPESVSTLVLQLLNKRPEGRPSAAACKRMFLQHYAELTGGSTKGGFSVELMRGGLREATRTELVESPFSEDATQLDRSLPMRTPTESPFPLELCEVTERAAWIQALTELGFLNKAAPRISARNAALALRRFKVSLGLPDDSLLDDATRKAKDGALAERRAVAPVRKRTRTGVNRRS